jgi:hypothetical protein
VEKERGEEIVVDQSSSSERETSDGVDRVRERALSGVRRPNILSAPWAEVRGAEGKGEYLWCGGGRGEEVGEGEELDSGGDSRTVVNIVEGLRV